MLAFMLNSGLTLGVAVEKVWKIWLAGLECANLRVYTYVQYSGWVMGLHLLPAQRGD